MFGSRLLTHLDLNDLSNPNQSAYKKNHSTETTLLKITNDITTNMEKKRVTGLCWICRLHLIQSTMLHLKLLSSWLGISGIALDWIQSNYYDRGQTVKIGENLSDSYTIKFGVLHWSVLKSNLLMLRTTTLIFDK